MRQLWLGCILLSTALGGQAASLGRHSGAAVIGRPLDIRAQALLAPGEDTSALCVQADVFYGDNQVSPGAVRTQIQKSAPDAEASLRIQSSVPVDEPIVTVYVRIGCNAPFSRRYVLLADLVTEPATSAAPATVSSPAPRELPQAREVLASPAAAPAPAGVATTPAPAASASPRAAAAEAPARPAAPKVRPATSSRPAERPASVVRRAAPAPRLELEPVDIRLELDRDPVLKFSDVMLSQPAASEEERAAAARLWKAINASPEDILRDVQKLETLEAEAKGLREQEARNQAALAALQAQVDQSRHLTWLVYGLGAALLAALAGLAFFWRKRREGAPDDQAARAWWAAAEAEKQLASELPMPDGKAGARALDLDLDLDLGRGDSLPPDSMRSLSDSELDADSSPAPLRAADKRDFAASQIGVSRSVATEELFDVQQQADFFISLGDHEQAIQVLRQHLAESHEPSPLAYLDLLKLYHKLDRRDDYERLRKDFNRVLNAGAPSFDHFSEGSRSLEDYEEALSRIQSLWPQPRVLDVIEKSIFRDQGDAEGEVFDLEAYRELLLLHAIAKDVIKRESADARGAQDFEHTAIKPLKAAGSPALATAVAAQMAGSRDTQPMDELPPASSQFGLDVDLDELSEISAFEASLPNVDKPVEPTAKPAPAPGDPVDLGFGNLIDFEVLDLSAPDDDASDKKR